MATLRIFGSCSGTEPMPGRHHTALSLTAGDRHYFFDAGEDCCHPAQLCGMDLLKTRAVFISHCHFDHVGGMAGLFRTIRKMEYQERRKVADGKVEIYIPEPRVWELVKQFLCLTDDGLVLDMTLPVRKPTVGAFYRDENLSVTGHATAHMKPEEDGSPRSFAYEILCGGKRVVFSGDIRQPEELLPALKNGCDLLLCETGHHSVQTICDFAERNGVGHLIFLHHGREILYNRPTVAEAISNCKIPVTIADDGMTLEF